MPQLRTEITDRNGGVHSQRALQRAMLMLAGHGYARPRLYHIVLLDHAAESPTSVRRFQGAIKALCRKLHQHRLPTRWRACIERDEEKGLHCHVFILVDATAANPCAIINAKRHGPQAWLHHMLASRFMDFHLAPPKADMHRVGGNSSGRRKNYATLAGQKLDDCLVWISYLVKRRSKPSDIRTIYLSSRDCRPAPTPPKPSNLPEVALVKKAHKEGGVYQQHQRERDSEHLAVAPIQIKNYVESKESHNRLPTSPPNSVMAADTVAAALAELIQRRHENNAARIKGG